MNVQTKGEVVRELNFNVFTEKELRSKTSTKKQTHKNGPKAKASAHIFPFKHVFTFLAK